MRTTTGQTRFSGRAVRALVLASLLGAGCGSDQPYAISKTILLAALASLKAKKKLQFSDAETLAPGDSRKTPEEQLDDRHKAWFIFRRTEIIGARHTNFVATDLIPLVEAQFDQVDTYVTDKIGPTGPLNEFAEPGGKSSASSSQPFSWDPDFHFDLANIAITIVGKTSANREDGFRQDRWRTVRSIVWHAAGLYDGLWSGNGDGAVLNQAAMDEILDRRLRTVERMRLQVNSALTESGTPRSPNNSGRGPWLDDTRVRVFEYPFFAKSLVDPGDLGVIWSPFGSKSVVYRAVSIEDSSNLETRFDTEPDSLSTSWVPSNVPDTSSYSRFPATGPANPSLALALDALFLSELDMWARTWLFCDHSIAAMHMEALRFAMGRRGQGADVFDALVGPKSPKLGAIMPDVTFDSNGKPQVTDDGKLFTDGVSTGPSDTGVFDSLVSDYRDLQVGDHVVLWNHHLYQFCTTGAWKLENAFVTAIDPVTTNWDETHGPIDPAVFLKPERSKLRLDGFGLDGKAYPDYLRALLGGFEKGFKKIQTLASTASGDVFVFTFSVAAETVVNTVVVRWAPYSTGFSVKPWWVFLDRIAPTANSSPYPTVAKMAEIIKESVVDASGRGSDYQSPPTSVQVPGEDDPRSLVDGVFFPLSAPVVQLAGTQLQGAMSWADYFTLRKNNGQVDTGLVNFKVKPEMLPGLFVRGQDQPIVTIRPRVRP
jgi:hypothetical protein